MTDAATAEPKKNDPATEGGDQAKQDTAKEQHGFQAEVKQLLHLMIHSLYSNKEIFLRELVSNASDACDKLRFAAVKNDALYEGDSELKIHVDYDAEAKTITISDNGIGMTHDEVIANVGTIAKSGTKEFFQSLSGDDSKDARLIGQFGVGFYSAFIVASKVRLVTRKAGERDAWAWESEGEGSYSLEPVGKATHGTDVILHLRDDEEEFLNGWRLRSLITKYSDHVAFPILLPKEAGPTDDDKDEAKEAAPEYEQVNKGAPLWTRSKSDIEDEEYKAFYKHVAHDMADPLAWTHNKVEGKLEYTSLLYLPENAPWDLYDRDQMHGVKLYVQRVFIMDDAEKLLPRYLRFVRGVVDSNDLPLNVSREILQNNKVIDSIRAGLTKRVLSQLGSLAKKEPEQYKTFWKTFGSVLKEGPGEDASNAQDIAKLLRFSSTQADEQTVSFEDYLARMAEKQEKIYYVTADSLAAAKNSPHLEIFKQKGIEVLLLTDRVDEWLVSHLRDFDGKTLQSVAHGELDLGDAESDAEKEAKKKTEQEAKELVDRIAKSLEDQVASVRVTHRLTDSPACIVMAEHEMSAHLQRILAEAGQAVPDQKPTLEINPTHPLIQRLDNEQSEDQFADWSSILFEQALLAEGGQLDDPGGFVKRLNQMLVNIAA